MNTIVSPASVHSRAASPTFFKKYWVWYLAMAIVIALPWLFFNWTTGRHSGFVLTMLSEIGLMVIFSLSFNMQMGQAGLLSFGHAVLFGLGGYCTAHALNAIKAGAFWLPPELVPLVGGLGGLGFGVIFGYLATQQRATAFAMITMGIGELVAAAALMFMTFFGGEGGITTNRMTGTSILGASYAAPWQMYYLILFWALVSVILMRLQTQTPLGKMANATRDNFERAQFVGYDPRMVRFYQFIVSGFFAGVAGALYAMLYEIVTFDAVSAGKSATALLATYIGGVGGFFGPILGAIVVILLQSGISLISSAWMLYVGVLFIVMVMYAPGGLWGLIMAHAPIHQAGKMRVLLWPYVRVLVPGVLVVVGFVMLAELISYVTIGASQNKKLKVGALIIDPSTAGPWIFGLLALVLGGWWLKRESGSFSKVWNSTLDQIKLDATNRGGAAGTGTAGTGAAGTTGAAR
jgi:branched-chain amino acid transport system permease protein